MLHMKMYERVGSILEEYQQGDIETIRRFLQQTIRYAQQYQKELLNLKEGEK